MSSVSIGKSESAASEGSEAQTAQRLDDVPLSVGRQFTLVSTLAAYSTLLLVGITHHEAWADEAEAWLSARDLGYRYLVFHELRYEGVPPLWPTILWIANHWFHLPYQSIGWIGGLCALAGCWFFCRYSPFPLWIRVLFPFTYFMAFQYAMVARPYVLLPLFAFMAAYFFADAERRPWRFVAATSALAMLCAMGTMFAMGLVAARTWYAFRSWDDVAKPMKKMTAALAVFVMVVVLIAVVNWPAADGAATKLGRPPTYGDSGGNSGFQSLPYEIVVAFFGSLIPSLAFLVVVGAWCACRRRFLACALPLALLLAFFVKVVGSLWHCGALTLIVMAALWIAWPLPAKGRAKLGRTLNALVLVGLACLFAVHIYWTARTLEMDYSRPYSGSLDAANFLRSVGADRSSTCGFGFHSVAIQPYFREGIFKNWPRGQSFWRPDMGNRNDESCDRAKWVVLPRCCTFDSAKQVYFRQDRSLRSWGYLPVHVSKGAMFFEGREVEPTDFIIYQLP